MPATDIPDWTDKTVIDSTAPITVEGAVKITGPATVKTTAAEPLDITGPVTFGSGAVVGITGPVTVYGAKTTGGTAPLAAIRAVGAASTASVAAGSGWSTLIPAPGAGERIELYSFMAVGGSSNTTPKLAWTTGGVKITFFSCVITGTRVPLYWDFDGAMVPVGKAVYVTSTSAYNAQVNLGYSVVA